MTQYEQMIHNKQIAQLMLEQFINQKSQLIGHQGLIDLKLLQAYLCPKINDAIWYVFELLQDKDRQVKELQKKVNSLNQTLEVYSIRLNQQQEKRLDCEQKIQQLENQLNQPQNSQQNLIQEVKIQTTINFSELMSKVLNPQFIKNKKSNQALLRTQSIHQSLSLPKQNLYINRRQSSPQLKPYKFVQTTNQKEQEIIRPSNFSRIKQPMNDISQTQWCSPMNSSQIGQQHTLKNELEELSLQRSTTSYSQCGLRDRLNQQSQFLQVVLQSRAGTKLAVRIEDYQNKELQEAQELKKTMSLTYQQQLNNKLEHEDLKESMKNSMNSLVQTRTINSILSSFQILSLQMLFYDSALSSASLIATNISSFSLLNNKMYILQAQRNIIPEIFVLYNDSIIHFGSETELIRLTYFSKTFNKVEDNTISLGNDQFVITHNILIIKRLLKRRIFKGEMQNGRWTINKVWVINN